MAADSTVTPSRKSTSATAATRRSSRPAPFRPSIEVSVAVQPGAHPHHDGERERRGHFAAGTARLQVPHPRHRHGSRSAVRRPPTTVDARHPVVSSVKLLAGAVWPERAPCSAQVRPVARCWRTARPSWRRRQPRPSPSADRQFARHGDEHRRAAHVPIGLCRDGTTFTLTVNASGAATVYSADGPRRGPSDPASRMALTRSTPAADPTIGGRIGAGIATLTDIGTSAVQWRRDRLYTVWRCRGAVRGSRYGGHGPDRNRGRADQGSRRRAACPTRTLTSGSADDARAGAQIHRGVRLGLSIGPGVEMADEQARTWIGSGLVTPVLEPETAMAPAAPERAVSRGRSRR